MRMRETALFLLPKIWRHYCVPRAQFPIWCRKSGDLQTFKAEIGMFMFAWIFRTFWHKMAVPGAKQWNGWCDVDPNKLVLTFGSCYLCATSAKINQQIQPWECRQTDTCCDKLLLLHYIRLMVFFPGNLGKPAAER